MSMVYILHCYIEDDERYSALFFFRILLLDMAIPFQFIFILLNSSLKRYLPRALGILNNKWVRPGSLKSVNILRSEARHFNPWSWLCALVAERIVRICCVSGYNFTRFTAFLSFLSRSDTTRHRMTYRFWPLSRI